METDSITHLRTLKKVNQERSKALELQIATLGISCPPEIRTEYEKIKQEIHTLDQAITRSRATRRSPAARKQGAPPAPPSVGIPPDTGASPYERAIERIGCPYPGMAPFRPEDTRFFYGRESEIQLMLKHLRQRRCLYVIGPSGSGKSSLIQAGLLPRLHQSQLFPPGYWLARGMRPGAQPIQTLGEAIGRELDNPAQAVAGLLAAHPLAQRLLLIFDQFEELFTQAGREEQSRFIAIMRALQEVKECALLIAMRADFYPDLMTCDLWPIAPSQRLDIGPLRGARLRQAIERPAADVGVRLEPELLERLMADAADEPGVLPLVQETMTVLWSEMQDHQLALSAYERMSGEGRSGLAAALAMKADATFDDLSKPRQAIASRIFLRLVQFGEGRADTRRQQPIAALRAAGDDPALFETTLHYLTENRLLTLSGTEQEEPRTKNQEPPDTFRFSVLGSRFSVVDIAHESLITGWKTFQRWLTERREAEQTRRRLDAKAGRWAEFGQAGGWLLDPFELREAERWLASPDAADLGFDPALPALVQASRAAIAEVEREHAARLEAEVVKRHMAFLAEASSALAASLDYETTLAQIARLAVPHLADWCTVDVLEEHGLIRPVALVHIEPEREALLHELHRQHAIDSHSAHPVAQVLRGGQPELAGDVSDARLLAIAESGELAHKLRQVGFASYMVLPLRVGERVLGAITFVSAAPEHQYGPDDLALAEELIRRAATAIENAQLFQERGQRIEQLATFNEIGRALSAVTRQDDLIALIYRQTSRLLDTANFSIALYDERTDSITFPLAYAQGSRIARDPISAHDGLLARVIQTRAPLLLQGQPPAAS